MKYTKERLDNEGPLESLPSWGSLSMREKNAYIRAAVRNGMVNLADIKKFYNEFAKGGFMPSESIRERIASWEGDSMTRSTVDPLSGKVVKKNNSFEKEAEYFTNALPSSIREQVLANPALADWLYSYSYNVGAGNFKKRVVPALERYYSGNGSVEDIQNSMWATGDSKLRGLAKRRARERQGVQDALWDTEMDKLNAKIDNISLIETSNFNDTTPFKNLMRKEWIQANPTVTPVHTTVETPQEFSVEPVVQEPSPYEKMLTVQRMFSTPTENTLPAFMPKADPNAPFVARTFGDGGEIHIKPSHRGRLTELKARTGKTEEELYNDGNPAHKKMVVFARNSRKWKHGDGGNLFAPGGPEDNDKTMLVDMTNVGLGAEKDPRYYVDNTMHPLDEVTVEYNPSLENARRQWMNEVIASNDATVVENVPHKEYNPNLKQTAEQGAIQHAYNSKLPFLGKIFRSLDKERIYRTTDPNANYDQVASVIRYIANTPYRQNDKLLKEMKKTDLSRYNYYNKMQSETDELYRLYLGLPFKGKYISKSSYRPQKGKASYERVYKLKDTNSLLGDNPLGIALHLYNDTHQTQFKAGDGRRDIFNPHSGFAEYTISLGKDANGNYISYYDDYDLNTDLLGNHKQGDMFGEGFTLYDRRYFDSNDSINALKLTDEAYNNYKERRKKLVSHNPQRVHGQIK